MHLLIMQMAEREGVIEYQEVRSSPRNPSDAVRFLLQM